MVKESFAQEPVENSEAELHEAEDAMHRNDELAGRGGILDRLQAAKNYPKILADMKKARMHAERDNDARRRAE